MTQYARPSSDITTTNWTRSTGAGTFASHIDEASADDADYIYTQTQGSGVEIKLGSVTDPAGNTSHTVNLRYYVAGSGGGERHTVLLLQGGTTIATVVNNAAMSPRATWNAVTYTLTTGEADAITDYTDLRLRFTAATLGAGEEYRISWAEMNVPDAPGGTPVGFRSMFAFWLGGGGVPSGAVNVDEAIALDAARSVAPAGAAGAIGIVSLGRAQTTTGPATAGGVEALDLLFTLDMDAAEGFTILESIALTWSLTATPTARADSHTGLFLAIAAALSASIEGTEQADLVLGREHGVSLISVGAAAGAIAVDRTHDVQASIGLLLAEAIALAIARDVDVSVAFQQAVEIVLGTERGLEVDHLTGVLASIGLSRTEAAVFGRAAGFMAAVGIHAYRGITTEGEVNFIFTPRHIFIVDSENRVFIVKRDERAFTVEREERTFTVKRGA